MRSTTDYLLLPSVLGVAGSIGETTVGILAVHAAALTYTPGSCREAVMLSTGIE